MGLRAPSSQGSASQTARLERLKPGLSIGQQLALLIAALLIGIVTGLISYLDRVQTAELDAKLIKKADTYARLVAAQVRSAVAFDDKETAREVFSAVAQDSEFLAATLYLGSGAVLHSLGEPGSVGLNARLGVAEQKVYELPDRMLAVAPVVSPEGPKGVLTLEFSKAELEASVRGVRAAGLAAGAVALLAGLILAVLIARSFSQRLRAIAHVAEVVASGDLTQDAVRDMRRDEIGSLARSFAVMLTQLKSLIGEMRTRAEQEQSRLQALVAQRTGELERRNGEMRLVLDNAGQGFVTIDVEGLMSTERSAVLQRWFGRAPEGSTLWYYLGKINGLLGLSLELGWEEVQAGVLPLEVTLDQMPKRFAVADAHYSIQFKPILDGSGKAAQTVVVISDITAEVAVEQSAGQERDLLQLLARARQDRGGVLEFLRDAGQLVDDITRGNLPEERELKHLLHTLKGNASVLGVQSLAGVCHDLETTLSELGYPLAHEPRDRLRSQWLSFRAKVTAVLEAEGLDGYSVSREELNQLIAQVRSSADRVEIARQLERLRFEPTEVRLRRLAAHASALAQRLGKEPLDCRVEPNGLRLSAEPWAKVWLALAHLVRNAVDHGLETAEERVALGKPSVATLALRTELRAGKLVIEVEDGGRGIDWETVRRSASRAGLPTDSQDDLVEALFRDGLSTKGQVTDVSGRGVGMGAVRSAVEARGGRIEVRTAAGRGTCVSLSWPDAVLIEADDASTAAQNRSLGGSER